MVEGMNGGLWFMPCGGIAAGRIVEGSELTCEAPPCWQREEFFSTLLSQEFFPGA